MQRRQQTPASTGTETRHARNTIPTLSYKGRKGCCSAVTAVIAFPFNIKAVLSSFSSFFFFFSFFFLLFFLTSFPPPPPPHPPFFFLFLVSPKLDKKDRQRLRCLALLAAAYFSRSEKESSCCQSLRSRCSAEQTNRWTVPLLPSTAISAHATGPVTDIRASAMWGSHDRG